MKLIFCSLMLSSFVLNLASAQTFTGGSGGSTGKILYAAIDAKVGYSSEASEDKSSIKSRKLTSYAGDINLGFRSYFNTIFAVNGEYALIKQLTNPSNVSNSNTQGKMFSISPLFGFEFGSLSILAKFPKTLSSEYTLDKKNSSNQEVKFTDAKVFGVQMNLMLSA